nr:hypothetical protein [Tanacetum cinerariifolium]
MRTRSSSNLPVVSPSNSSTSNPKRRNRRRSKQPFILEESSIDTMADQRTLAELLRSPTEGTTNLYNEISNFQQRFDESFHEAWDIYKDLLRACPHHGFIKLHQLDAFYNALNPADQDSLNATAGGNLLERHTQDVLKIIKNKSKCLAADGNTFLELQDNIQGYVSAAAVNYNQGNSVYRPPEDERVEETLTEPDLSEYTIKVPPLPKILKALLSNKEKLQELANTPLNENCSTVILKKLPKKLGDPGKFLIPCGFSLPKLTSNRMTLELANRAICTPAGIARVVFVLVGKFTFPADFVIIDYESDPRVLLILGRHFLRTARALIDVYGEEMILLDGDERLTLNMRHDTLSYSNQTQNESINLINVFNNSSEEFLEDLFSTNQQSGNPTFSSHPELTWPKVKDDIFALEGGNVLPEKLLDLDSTKDLHPPLHVNPLSGSTTYSSSPLLEELANELDLITFPSKYDDDLQFDVESDLKEIEFLLHQDIDSSLKDSIDQSNLANLADNFVDSMPEMFTDEHAPNYSSPPIFDEYDDDFLEVESDTENVYDDPFDSKGKKIKESKLLIDELDLPYDFLLPFEYDSFISKDFSRVDAFPSTNNKDKVFNPGILSQENPFEIITRVVQDKKLPTSNASLVIKDFDPPLYELPFFKEVPSIPRNLKTRTDGFCPPVFISSASIGNHVSKSNRANVYLMAYLRNGL